jgi:hypothetical protein
MYLEPRMNITARRVAIHHSVDSELRMADQLVTQGRVLPPQEARRKAALDEAFGDLNAALNRGQDVTQELLLIQAMCQLWSEHIEQERAR